MPTRRIDRDRPFDRDRLCKLLGLLGSQHDGEALAAARHATALLRQAGLVWDEVVVQVESPPTSARREGEDERLLRELLASDNVSDVLKIRLADMQASAKRGRLGDNDRRLLRILHRKAVLDGVIVTP